MAMQALTFNITVPMWVRTKLAAKFFGPKAFWSKSSTLRLCDVPKPEMPGAGWVRCRTRMGGVCGSDLGILQLHRRPDSILSGFSSMPMILGHENVAEVVEAHDSADAHWVGKRVCVEPTLGCSARGIDPPCRRCAVGEYGACENFAAAGQGRYKLPAGTSIGYNSRTGGSWGEFFCAHVCQLMEVPAELTDRTAVLTDPLACSVHGVLRTDLSDARLVCVFGGGILGLGAVGALRAMGYTGEIDIIVRHDFQAELASAMGATRILPERAAADMGMIADRVGGSIVTAHFGAQMLTGGYDVVYECTGSATGFNTALKFTRPRGQVVLIGTCEGGSIDLTPIWFQELSIIGAYGRQRERWNGESLETYQIVHKLMTTGKLSTEGLLTHTAPLSEFADVLAAATDKKNSRCVKAAFQFD